MATEHSRSLRDPLVPDQPPKPPSWGNRIDEPVAGVGAELHWLRADDPTSVMAGNWYSGTIAGQVMQGIRTTPIVRPGQQT